MEQKNYYEAGQEARRKFEEDRAKRAEFQRGWHSLDNEYGECAPSPLPKNGNCDEDTSD